MYEGNLFIFENIFVKMFYSFFGFEFNDYILKLMIKCRWDVCRK